MTVHGTSLASIRTLIGKAIGRSHHRILKYKHVRNPEAYQQAIEANQRLGIQVAKKRGPKLKILSAHKRSRRPVTLAKI